MLSYQHIRKYALQAGFTLCGVARSRVLAEQAEHFAAGLAASGDNVLGYLVRDPARRLDPSTLLAGVRTVVVCAVTYRNSRSGGYPVDFTSPKICSYALGGEYQPKIKAMLGEMAIRLSDRLPGLGWRALCDTSAILEKAWAVEAGLGWIGRNSLLITPEQGSFLLLGELLLDEECDFYDEPYTEVGCGECRRCEESCPAGALRSRSVDTGRCISALTIEKTRTGIDPERLHGWVFGCDECQNACPYNRARAEYSHPLFAPCFDPADFPAERWSKMTGEEFRSHFIGTPLVRAGLERLKKNIAAEKKQADT
jgi:epoxyqueuosine reductase